MNSKLITFFLLLFLISSLQATVIVLDFTADSSNTFRAEDGFNITAINSGSGTNHFDIFNDAHGNTFNPGGDDDEIHLHGANNAEEILLTEANTTNFNLLSLDVENILIGGAGSWQAIGSNGNSFNFTTTGTINFGSIFFDVSSVTFRSSTIPNVDGASLLTFDNVVIENEGSSAVPEPSTLIFALMGSFVLFYRKRG